MTDKEIIKSFLDNNQHGIREAYYAWRVPFEQSVTYRTHLDDELMDDAYQEAFIRLQQHILTGRLTVDNIEKSLLAYIKEIGHYTALEIINKRRELPISQLQSSQNDNEDEKRKKKLSHKPNCFDPNDQMEQQERERIIRELVNQMGQPCAPLLLGHLWENKSMSELATELGYSNADSAKSQKSKCMKKVMIFIKPKLIKYGYGC